MVRLLSVVGLALFLLPPVAAWSDVGPVDVSAVGEPGFHNFFGKVELGAREFDGVPFDLKDAMVRVRAGKQQRIEVTPVTAACIHFLYFTENAGDRIGAMTLVYADGGKAELPLTSGLNIHDWWKAGDLAFAKLAYTDAFKTGENTEQKIGFWRFSVHNPHPDTPLTAIEIANTDGVVTINLIAVTCTAECGEEIGGIPVWTVGMDEEQFLLVTLKQQGTGAGKERACSRLAAIGTLKSVPVLAGYLTDDLLSPPARLALAAMGYPEARAALRGALAAASGKTKAGIIESLGVKGMEEDAVVIAPAAGDADPVVAMSAALALGRIGGPTAIAALKPVAQQATGRLRAVAYDALLHCGELLDGQDAFTLYKDLYLSQPTGYIGTAAYKGMIRAAGGNAGAYIAAALRIEAPDLWKAALPAVRDLADPALTQTCAALLGQVPKAALPGMVDALAQRGDKAIAPALTPLLKDADPLLALKTVKALALAGDASSVPALVTVAAKGEDNLAAAAFQALDQLNTPDVSAALLDCLKGTDAAETAVTAKVIGARREDSMLPALRELAQSPEAGIRAAAAQALGEVGVADDAALLCNAIEQGESSVQTAAQKALIALGKRLGTPDAVSGNILAALGQGNTAAHCALLEVCGNLPNEKLLQALNAAAMGADEAENDAAIRALAATDNPAALPSLMALLGTAADPAHRTLLFRGVAKLVSAKDTDAALRETTLTQALALTQSPDEKKLLLGPLGGCPSLGAMKTAETYLDAADVAAEAAVAWGRIARELAPSQRDEIQAVLPKALAAAQAAGLPAPAMQPLTDVKKALAAVPAAADTIRFEHVVIDPEFRSEGVAVADVNRDNLKDIIVGDVWYEAPGWQAHEIRTPEKYDPATAYSKCFAAFAEDVNKDGWPDVIVIGFPGAPAYWYENQGDPAAHWKEHLLATEACGETPLYADLLGDGKPAPVFAMNSRITWFRPGQDKTAPWLAYPMTHMQEAFAKFGHGLGVGDLNKDGRNDVLVTNGWWEGPVDRTRPDWGFHQAKLGPDSADMIVYDVNADGKNDVISSSAHDYGIWWFEQGQDDGKTTFTQHEIDKSVSETHALILADLNNDSLPDLVTGKRYFAHGEHDPGALEPSELFWCELQRPEPGKVTYTKHVIDSDSGVGTQFAVLDFDDDGLLDVVVSNKKGVHVFLQRRDH